MKLGMIIQPKPEEFDHLKELGLDFAELDCNPVEFFGKPVDELKALAPELKAASERTGVEVGAVGRWASHILNEDGSVNEEEWNNVQGVIDFGRELGAKYYLCSVAYVPQLTYYGNITAAIHVLRKIVAAAKEAGMETYFVDHTGGVYAQAAAGFPFDALCFASKGAAITDLVEDMAADGTTVQEQRG